MFEELFKDTFVETTQNDLYIAPVNGNLIIFSDIYDQTREVRLVDEKLAEIVKSLDGTTTTELCSPYRYTVHIVSARRSNEFVDRLRVLEQQPDTIHLN